MAEVLEANAQTTEAYEPQDLEDKIRRRAYQLYEERGRENGHELDDWLRAEEEIAGKRRMATAAA